MTTTTNETIMAFSGKYRFLSNFYPCGIRWLGIDYPTVEHAFAATKNHDQDYRLKVASARDPQDAKSMGRAVPLRPDWEDIKEPVLHQLLRIKFFGSQDLGMRLILTEGLELIEGNKWGDDEWGMIWNERTKSWEGKNKLGRLLQAVRTELQRAGVDYIESYRE